MSKPRVESGTGLYRLYWDEYQLVITASRVREHRDGRTIGEILIESSAPGVPRHIHQAQLNMVSTASRKTLENSLKTRYSEVNWSAVLEALCFYVLQAVRQGEPVEELNTLGSVEPPRFLLYPLLAEGLPTILFGEGGTGKSLMGQIIAQAVQLPWQDNNLGLRTLAEPTTTLYLDWETDRREITWRLKCLENGTGLLALDQHYRRCALPLADDIENVQEMILEHQIGCLIIDSAAAACGGDINNVEPVSRFFGALRQLKITSLIIAHTAKNGDDKGRTPFGSVFFRNYARSIWEIRKRQEEGEDTVEIGLYHTKVNSGKLQRPLGFRLTFGEETIRIARTDLAKVPGLSERLSGGVRIKALLGSNGKMTNKAIEEELDLEPAAVRQALKRLRDNGVVERFGDEWGLLAQA